MRCSCNQENDSSARQCARCGQPLPAASRARLWLDLAAGLSLLAALAIVFLVDRVKGTTAPPEPTTETVEITPTEMVVPTNAMRIAVTPPEYDDMGKLLTSLGAGYRYTAIDLDDLLDPVKLAQFDVVFLTCGTAPKHWLEGAGRQAERDKVKRYTVRPQIARKLHDSLRSYVEHGGTLYASDWRYEMLAIAFPEHVDRSKEASGAVQTVEAEVVDRGLRGVAGSNIKLRFDKPGWRPAAFKDSTSTVFLRGEYETAGGDKREGPLLNQVAHRGGNIIYTSFHNEQQNSELELQLLRYLVFTTVTAKVDTTVRSSLVRGGFSPVDRSLLSASRDNPAITRTYESKGGNSLQFVLGFEDRGAELRLTVTGPDNARFQQTATSTLTIDVPKAAAGTWTYSIAPLKVPYQNFPFTLTIGEK